MMARTDACLLAWDEISRRYAAAPFEMSLTIFFPKAIAVVRNQLGAFRMRSRCSIRQNYICGQVTHGRLGAARLLGDNAFGNNTVGGCWRLFGVSLFVVRCHAHFAEPNTRREDREEGNTDYAQSDEECLLAGILEGRR